MEEDEDPEAGCHSDENETQAEYGGDGQLLRSQCATLYERAQTIYSFAHLYLAVTYRRNHVRVRKDNDLVAANFPKVEGIELLAPAFLRPERIPSGFFNGTCGPTDSVELDQFIGSVVQRHHWCTYLTLDFVSEDGRNFPALLLSSSTSTAIKPKNSDSQKLRVWIQAGVHGNEPAGDQAVLALLGKMDADEAWTSSILDKMDIVMLPRYNPDGVANFQRTLITGVDVNRDHIKFARQQTRDIKKIFNTFSPHIAVDMHEYSAATRYGGTYLQASDAFFAAAKNLNIHPSISRISEELFAPLIARGLEARGFRWEPYVTGRNENTAIILTEAGSDAKIGRNAMGLTQCITFLTESRGIGIADQKFERRTAASLTMVESIIQTAADHATEIYDTVESAVSEFIASERDIIVTDAPRPQTRNFTMIDCETGAIEQVPVRFFSTTPSTPILTRARPKAYLIPGSEPDLASRLRDLGLNVLTLPHEYHGVVEAYHITTASFEDTYYEGIVPVNVNTRLVTREVKLATGAFWISMRQQNAALAFMAIEPENVDSWVRSNIVPVGIDEQLPYFRVMVMQASLPP